MDNIEIVILWIRQFVNKPFPTKKCKVSLAIRVFENLEYETVIKIVFPQGLLVNLEIYSFPGFMASKFCAANVYNFCILHRVLVNY